MIQIVLVDDKSNYSESLKYILENTGEIAVVGCAANGYEALESCKKYNPDVVLMDLQMPVCGGAEGTRLVKQYNKKIKVIILTTFYDDWQVDLALQNGADGCILKDIETYKLICSIKSIKNGTDINNLAYYKMTSNKYLD